MGKSTEHNHNRLLRKTAFYKINLIRVFSQVWVSFVEGLNVITFLNVIKS